MQLLFIHRHMPGQFANLARRLAADPGNRVVFVAERIEESVPGATAVAYRPSRAARPETHRYVRPFEDAVLHGQAVARICRDLKRRGMRPDAIVAHPGWGGSLFVKDVFPDAPLLAYCEFFYRGRGADLDFDPAEPPGLDALCRTRSRNAHLLLSLAAAERGVSPTAWQHSLHPPELRDKIAIVFDGIDTARVRPRPSARFELPDGRVLRRGDPVVTFVARELEPYRGFPTFLRAAADICRRAPDAAIVIAGGDGVAYGSPPGDGRSWRDTLLAEVPVDPARVAFVGRLPYPAYLRLLQVSAVHVYLTVPFVLSWSMLEAMAAGCVVVGSATPPVAEVIEHAHNGFLTDFFDAPALAATVVALLARRESLASVRHRARKTVLSRYALDVCLPQQLDLLEAMMTRRGEAG